MATSPVQSIADAVALARVAPITRAGIADLAAKVPGDLASEAASAALETAGVNAAMALAFAAAAGKAKLDPDLTRALLPEVTSLDHVGPLVRATRGSAVEVLAPFLEEARGDLELECLVLLIAADALGKDEDAPRALLVRARWLARHHLVQDASVFFGGAAQRLGNAELSSLAAPHVNRARRSKKLIEETLEIASSRALDVLPEVDGSRLSTGFTVKHEAPAVGRNDPCPCGSGKKYKKCHGAGVA